jgi:hypothetical protein
MHNAASKAGAFRRDAIIHSPFDDRRDCQAQQVQNSDTALQASLPGLPAPKDLGSLISEDARLAIDLLFGFFRSERIRSYPVWVAPEGSIRPLLVIDDVEGPVYLQLPWHISSPSISGRQVSAGFL